VSIIQNDILKDFEQSVQVNLMAIKPGQQNENDINENEFIDASRLIYDSVRELRKALLLIPQEDDSNPAIAIDIDEEYIIQQEEIQESAHSAASNLNEDEANNTSKINDEISNYGFTDETEELTAIEETNVAHANMTEAQKEEFYQNFNSFRLEKNLFDKEVLKWDDTSNDIIVLSKEMCVLMMDMTNFTRNKGPYKTIPDIIGAAKKISHIGSKLEKLVRELASQCPVGFLRKYYFG
jgi:hypothetical protein